MYNLRAPLVLPWLVLSWQFGSNYKELRNFKAAFVDELRKVKSVYPQVYAEPTPEGLALRPSLTSVPVRAPRVDAAPLKLVSKH
jgi:hypothetical protein